MSRTSVGALALLLAAATFGCDAVDVHLSLGDAGVTPAADATAEPDAADERPDVPDAAAPLDAGPSTPTALRLAPGALRLVDHGTTVTSTVFRAIATFDDGDRDVSGDVTWMIDDPELGSVSGGAFTGSGVGGRTRVRASLGPLAAQAELEIVLDVVVLAPDAPADAARLFATDTSSDAVDAAMLELRYPAHETMFPLNARNVRYQWRGGSAVDLYEVAFDSPSARIRYYTAAPSYVPSEGECRWLARTHQGGSLTWYVRGVSRAAPGIVYRSSSATIYYSRAEVSGAAYFWSTTEQGLMRATLDAPLATKLFPAPGSGDHACVGCHTISRDGRRMAFAYGGGALRVAEVRGAQVYFPPASSPASHEDFGWGAFSPDGARLLYAHDGVLSVLDVEHGASLGDVALGTGAYATHPDWSPDGRTIAVAIHFAEIGEPNEHVGDQIVRETSIATLEARPDGTFGPPRVLVSSPNEDDALFFPTYSPDGRWLAYVKARGRSKDNATAEVLLVAADGSVGPLALARLNRRVGLASNVSNLANTMPTWAPSSRSEISWLGLSSRRAYGEVLPSGARDQLWLAAIDPTRARAGDDPSYGALWLPFQSTASWNHRAQWTTATDDRCPSTVDVCGNGLDDDCDQRTDVACCTPAAEVCVNGVDDDCDGAIDEGCGCSATEICGNGVDDDCDSKTDLADEDCRF